jgi:hypothetical protein
VWDDEITTERIQEILNKYENQKHWKTIKIIW